MPGLSCPGGKEKARGKNGDSGCGKKGPPMKDLAFFWLSKLGWMAVSPDLLLVLAVLAGVFLLLTGRTGKAKFILCLAGLCLLIITFVPLGKLMLAPLENRFSQPSVLPAHVDGIICLGGAENPVLSKARGQAELWSSAERYLGFIKLMRTYPEAVHLFSGGSGLIGHQEVRDADVARMVFRDLGVETGAILFESRSRNTWENALMSKAVADPRPGQTWILVTTAAHMPRSVGVFRKLSWPVVAYPVDHTTDPEENLGLSMGFSDNLCALKSAFREWVGLTAYYVTGKTSSWMPGPSAGMK